MKQTSLFLKDYIKLNYTILFLHMLENVYPGVYA